MTARELVGLLESANGWTRDTSQQLLIQRKDPETQKLLDEVLQPEFASPKELTRWEDCARGADVLLRTVLEMDQV